MKEQDTVGMRRSERKEQEELAGKKKIESARTKLARIGKLEERQSDIEANPRRVARIGKPLKR